MSFCCSYSTGCNFLLCAAKFPQELKTAEQNSHSYNGTPVCVATCSFNFFSCEKLFAQNVHRNLKARSVCFSLTCLCKFFFPMNSLLQILHDSLIRSIWWFLMCVGSEDSCTQLPHCGHCLRGSLIPKCSRLMWFWSELCVLYTTAHVSQM